MGISRQPSENYQPFTTCHAVGGWEIGSISRAQVTRQELNLKQYESFKEKEMTLDDPCPSVFKNVHQGKRWWPFTSTITFPPARAQVNKKDKFFNNTRKVKMALIWLHPSFFASGTYGDFSTITASNFFFQEFINTNYKVLVNQDSKMMATGENQPQSWNLRLQFSK